jgi:hypothetical protein
MNQNMLASLQSTSPVTIVGNPELNNAIVTPLINKEDGSPKVDNTGRPLASIRVEQKCTSLNGTFLRAQNRVAFIGGTMEELENLVKAFNIKVGSQLPGKIIMKESLTPMWNNHQPKINPGNGEVVTINVNGNLYPIYMQQSYTEDKSKEDFLIRDAADVINILNKQTIAAATNTPVVETANIPETAA